VDDKEEVISSNDPDHFDRAEHVISYLGLASAGVRRLPPKPLNLSLALVTTWGDFYNFLSLPTIPLLKLCAL
jgi:hypothetical protein